MRRPPAAREFAALFSEGLEVSRPLTLTQKRQRREALFAETTGQRLAREALDLLHVLARPLSLPAIIACLKQEETAASGSPDPLIARNAPDGLAGPADLSPEALVDGYGEGLFMRALISRPAWWSPALRCARALETRTTVAPESERLAFDESFDETLVACARASVRRGEAGALTPSMLDAFARMHDRGDVHSFVLSDPGGAVLAGGWGVSSGRAFFTEGLFETRAGAAAHALSALEADLAGADFLLHATRPELARAAGVAFPIMTRDAFLELNRRAGASVRRGSWRGAPDAQERSFSVAA